jgi:pimeloyl-ACP methyl ester carboxylesterase
MHTFVQSIELPTGVRVEYAEHGRADGDPVLFLHGYGDSWRSFEQILPLLPASIRALAVTQRGHGDADRPSSGYGTSDFAADAVALLDSLGIGSAVLVGHSMGAAVAQRIALDHPGRVDGLVFAGGSTSWAYTPAIAGELASEVDVLADPVDPEFARAFQAGTTAEPIDPALLDMFVEESCKLPARVWQAVMKETLIADFADELPAITAPTLVVWGERDRDISPYAEQEALIAAIPGSDLLVYVGAGHALHWERPEHFAGDLAVFVERLRARSPLGVG